VRHKLRAAALAVALLIAALAFRAQILAALGRFLVNAEAPARADVILVLAGDGYGHRILSGAELAKQGYAAKVLVSGPAGAYGNHECELAIPFAVKAGYPESYFVHAEHQARSTGGEAEVLVPQLRMMGAKRVLLVTSNFHTRRAGRIFRRAAPDLTFIVFASPDEDFTPDGWWRDRNAQKIFLVEWEKIVADWLGL
jgi:uncharacterized SAM-binding protein YcdF (DUF218 family)